MAEGSPYIQQVVEGYEQAAVRLIPAYDALIPERVLRPVLNHLPVSRQTVLDVGAGTGSIAAWLSDRGCDVTAIEPSHTFRRHAQQTYRNNNIRWTEGHLPGLKSLPPSATYDSILVIGVLHHLQPDDQKEALSTLSDRLRPNGKLVMSLRHGPCPSDRPGFGIVDDALLNWAMARGLNLRHKSRTASIQDGNRRAGVTWTWLVMGAPAG